MISSKHLQQTRSGLGRALQACALILALGLSAQGQERDEARRNATAPPPPPPPQGPSGLALGDETIGTLPIQGPAQPFTLVESLFDPRPSFYLQGSRFDVFSTVENCAGRAAARLHVIDDETDTIRLVFVGRPRLKLHRELIDDGAVQIGLLVPGAFGLATIDAQLGQRRLTSFEAQRVALPIPEAQLDAVEAVFGRVLHLAAENAAGQRTDLRIRSGRFYLFVEQTH